MNEPKIITKEERVKRSGGGCASCGKATLKIDDKIQVQTLPSRWEMLKNLVVAAKDAATSGLAVRSPEDTEKALRICDECPHLIIDDGNARCRICGCHLKYKTALESWKCPIGKW